MPVNCTSGYAPSASRRGLSRYFACRLARPKTFRTGWQFRTSDNSFARLPRRDERETVIGGCEGERKNGKGKGESKENVLIGP